MLDEEKKNQNLSLAKTQYTFNKKNSIMDILGPVTGRLSRIIPVYDYISYSLTICREHISGDRQDPRDSLVFSWI